MKQANHPVPVTTNTSEKSVQKRKERATTRVNASAGPGTFRRPTTPKTGAAPPSNASWAQTRGEFPAPVAQLTRQPAAIRVVTSIGAAGPQSGVAIALRVAPTLSPRPSTPAVMRITTHDPPTKTNGMNVAAAVRQRNVHPGRRLSATKDDAVSTE
jgi:hypothetical protein